MNKNEFREIQKKLRLTNEGVSETMDVDLFQVQQWASGTWDIPRSMAKFLRTLLSAKRDLGAVYMSGYGKGLNSGRKEGRLDIVEDYTVGYGEGYSEGLKDKHLGAAEAYCRGHQLGFIEGCETEK